MFSQRICGKRTPFHQPSDKLEALSQGYKHMALAQESPSVTVLQVGQCWNASIIGLVKTFF